MISSCKWPIFPLSVFLFCMPAYGQENDEDALEPWSEPFYVVRVDVRKDLDDLLIYNPGRDLLRIALTSSAPEEKEEIKRLTDTVFRSFIRHSQVRVRLVSGTAYVTDIEEVETKNY